MHAEAIYKGATRPAMKFGIPLPALVTLFGLGMLIVLWVGTLFTWWVVAVVLSTVLPTLLWMRYVTHHDDQRLRQMVMATRLRLGDRNHALWRARSYSPYPYRGTLHARRA